MAVNGGPGEAQKKKMAGMVRADLFDLANRDDGPVSRTQSLASETRTGQLEANQDEQRKAEPAEEELETNVWDVDMKEVICLNEIGQGAFGKVYRGTYRTHTAAVKLMTVPDNVSGDDLAKLRADFRQEINVWNKLDHPNIVKWAILSEFMEHGTLRHHLSKLKYHPERDVIRLALDIARGFEYLHANKVVHRDLKSENILLNKDYVAKIADFGVSRTEAENLGDMTAETGTVRWMAPEVINHQPYDRKVDTYSFGIVLWELFTLGYPFRGLTMVQLAFAVVNKNERPAIPSHCPEKLAKLMTDCWQPNAAARPEFTEVVQRLEAMQKVVPKEEKRGTLLLNDQGGCKCSIL